MSAGHGFLGLRRRAGRVEREMLKGPLWARLWFLQSGPEEEVWGFLAETLDQSPGVG